MHISNLRTMMTYVIEMSNGVTYSYSANDTTWRRLFANDQWGSPRNKEEVAELNAALAQYIDEI